jgi:alkaline phosphatase D
VDQASAVLWSRATEPSTLVAEWSLASSFDRSVVVRGPNASPASDLVAKVRLAGLPAGQRVFYRTRFEGAHVTEWIAGSFGTAPSVALPRDVLFAWSGDTNGQGWGIDPARGGMPAYRALLERAPELFIHCGDQIYADDPILEEKAIEGGAPWRNIVVPEKSHVAETLADYRGAFRYARHCAEVRALSAAVPFLSIWDDHEVHNNWFPGEVLVDPRYSEAGRVVDTLMAHARRAMFEYTPTLRDPNGPMYRSVRWGPLVEIFLLDGRTYRTPNEPAPPDGVFLGETQRVWLEEAVARSTATWKVIACDMPIGLDVSEPARNPAHAPWAYDGWANGDGPAKERELELARILSTWKARRVKNVVWLTADVHYAAAHRYDPARAAFKDFDPFWEFVAGPMHASQFPRKLFDDTFGPELVWASADRTTFGSPATGSQYFGLVRIDGTSRALTVTLVDMRGRDLHTERLEAS